MAKNLGRKYATMPEDERRKFAQEEEEGSRELPAELAFDDPRNENRIGQHYPNLKEEIADPEHRDGMSALLDDKEHQRIVHDTKSARKDDA